MTVTNGPAPAPPPDHESLKAFFELYPRLRELLQPPDPRDQITAREVIARYLEAARMGGSEQRQQFREAYLGEFAQLLGERRVTDCIPNDLQRWIASHPTWKSQHTIFHANAVCQSAFNWARRNRLVRENPFWGLTYRKGQPHGR